MNSAILKDVGRIQRVLLVLILLPSLMLLTAAAVPAVALLPFTRHGGERAVGIITTLAAFVHDVLVESRDHRPDHPRRRRPASPLVSARLLRANCGHSTHTW
ncbi:dTMP kinase [Streptomyces sp. NPDC005402]|uniref:dTMP kinase n=1 Tax=Streptomyces sp. NPDC005402 TaxID=3155338 RepID=UPI0033BC7C42